MNIEEVTSGLRDEGLVQRLLDSVDHLLPAVDGAPDRPAAPSSCESECAKARRDMGLGHRAIAAVVLVAAVAIFAGLQQQGVTQSRGLAAVHGHPAVGRVGEAVGRVRRAVAGALAARWAAPPPSQPQQQPQQQEDLESCSCGVRAFSPLSSSQIYA